MINRIRVVTLLVMVLGVFALLQLISGSLFFSSLHHSQKSFVVSNQLREQQGELTSTWDLMLQTRINLSRSAVRMMMDSSNQQSNAKVELLDSARKTLAQAATHYKKFKSMAPLPEMVATSRNIDEKYKNYYTALTELIDYLDYGNTGAYFAQPTQGMQNAMGEAFAQYALSSEKLYRDIVTDNADDYRFAQWQLAIIALVVVLILLVAWYGIRRMLLTPLAKIIAHIREIAGGNLANTLTIDGRSEMGDLAQSVSHMQRSLTDTVTHVREGSDAIYAGTREIAAGNTDLSSRTEQQASALEETAASMEQLTATVKQNADNARQASQLAQSASDTAQHGGKVVDGVVKTMHEIADSSKKIADIISVIDGIAFQTNILALNAAVEAARAGEQTVVFKVLVCHRRTVACGVRHALEVPFRLYVRSVCRIVGRSVGARHGDVGVCQRDVAYVVARECGYAGMPATLLSAYVVSLVEGCMSGDIVKMERSGLVIGAYGELRIDAVHLGLGSRCVEKALEIAVGHESYPFVSGLRIILVEQCGVLVVRNKTACYDTLIFVVANVGTRFGHLRHHNVALCLPSVRNTDTEQSVNMKHIAVVACAASLHHHLTVEHTVGDCLVRLLNKCELIARHHYECRDECKEDRFHLHSFQLFFMLLIVVSSYAMRQHACLRIHRTGKGGRR